MNKSASIKCDECNHEFSLNAVNINEAIVKLEGIPVILTYFVCPKCNKIYRVSIKDKRYYELMKDIAKIEKKIRKNNDSGRAGTPENAELISMSIRKHMRLSIHLEKTHSMFPGTFVFVTSKQRTTIEYLP